MGTLPSVGQLHVAEFGMSPARTVDQRSAGEVTGRFHGGLKVGIPWYRSQQACAAERSGAVGAQR